MSSAGGKSFKVSWPSIVFWGEKSDLFRFLIERTWQRVLGWKEKLLSFAGKEILIKSVLMALPIYPMMCFKIPSSVCKRITSIIYKFWWSNSKEGKAIHWVKIPVLSKPKSEGGLNFRDLELFNDALFAKQFWRLHESPSSPVGGFLRAKYYKDRSILDSQLGTSPSYAWRSLWSAGMKVKEWMVIDGEGNPRWLLEDHGSY